MTSERRSAAAAAATIVTVVATALLYYSPALLIPGSLGKLVPERAHRGERRQVSTRSADGEPT